MVKKFFFFVALSSMLFFTLNACRQTNVNAADETSAVSARVEQLRVLMLNPDTDKLGEIVSDQLSYSHSDGHLNDKKTFINDLVVGNSHFLTLAFTDQTVAISGDVAIVRLILKADSHDKGKDPTHPNLKVLLIWQKINGKWMLLARASNPNPVK